MVETMTDILDDTEGTPEIPEETPEVPGDTPETPDEVPEDTPEIPDEVPEVPDTHRTKILRNVYQKLDGMMMSFGMPMYNSDMTSDDMERYVGMSLNDTMRELKLSNLDNIGEMSVAEYHIENRCVYHKLRMLRNSASIFFKFSTAVDGKTVDKSMIPKMINEMIKEYDTEWKKWLSTGGLIGTTTGNVWSRTSTEGTTWHRELNG